MTTFEDLKELCRKACHERNACKEGFEAMLRTESVAELMQVWRDNWQDLYESKYADLIALHIAGVVETARIRREMRRCDMYVNESVSRGMVIVTEPTRDLFIGGNARCYVFGTEVTQPFRLTVADHAQVYCRTKGVTIEMRDHAFGFVTAGDVTLRDRAFLKGCPDTLDIRDAAKFEALNIKD